MAFTGMEYMEGGDLASFVYPNCEKLSFDDSKFIFCQIVDAVLYLHDHGICHRDLKPGNILLLHPDPYTLVKVADFGISKSELLHSTMDSAAGTPCFMAPEILYGEDSYTKKVDIWSLGVILYMSLTGCIATARDGKVSLTLPTFQFSARNLLKKMLQINPKKRPSIDGVAQHKWLKKSRVRGRIDTMKMKLRDGLIPHRKTAAKHTAQTTHFRKGQDIQDLFSSATKFQNKQKS